MKLEISQWILAPGLALALAACGSNTSSDQPHTPDVGTGTAGYLYVGACTPSVCNGLPVSEIGCADGEPEYVCSAANGGACSIQVTCPGPSTDPDQSTSFAPCDDVQCGPTPNAPTDACPVGTEWTGAQCGSVNGGACAWAHGCYAPREPVAVDESKLGQACGVDTPCSEGQQCVVFPREADLEGAFCVQDPCAALSCPSERCVVQETYPAQVSCR